MSVSPIDVGRSLIGIQFPLSKEDVCNHARDVGVDSEILGILDSLPAKTYETVTEIEHAVQKELADANSMDPGLDSVVA